MFILLHNLRIHTKKILLMKSIGAFGKIICTSPNAKGKQKFSLNIQAFLYCIISIYHIVTVSPYFRTTSARKRCYNFILVHFFSLKLTLSDAHGADDFNFNFTDERTWCHLLQLQLPGPRFTKDIRFI